MKNNYKKFLIPVVVITLFLFVFVAVVSPVNAQLSSGNLGIDYAENLGLGNEDPRDMTVSIIHVIFGFLALLAVLIIIIGVGLAAGAGEDKAAFARKMMVAGAIGLVIILAAWGIARFVLLTVLNTTQ